ncbi:hypothetical protein P879_11679 [Paragonimus westermani]|uniref:Uncharacterized protein n=1 Tax=Paragonimus westermani TaxID=34504 RepID=A0A8T0D7T3_9TREM|nr:hypothetical protein P879_11679 [Paragonimus westermani]
MVSVVPQYDLSEPESPGSPSGSHRNLSGDCKGRHDSSRSSLHHIQPRSPDDGSSFVEERVNVLLSGEADRNGNDVVVEDVRKKSKVKKHRKHKHRSGKKRSKKTRNLEAYDEASDVWVSSAADVTSLRPPLSVDGLEKKMKKHKKHKREGKERKKKDRKHIGTEPHTFMQM